MPENKSVSSSKVQASISNQSSYILTNTGSQTNLSKQIDVSIDFKRFHDSIEYQDSSILSVYLNDKQSGSIMDSFTISSSYFHDIFLSCDSMTSFSKKVNADKNFGDNYYGDLVVADFNFDGLDDIAVVNNAGGNSGTLYSFYSQEGGRKVTHRNFDVFYIRNESEK